MCVFGSVCTGGRKFNAMFKNVARNSQDRDLLNLHLSCRMQFIFLYYDQNRNGRLEVEEAGYSDTPGEVQCFQGYLYTPTCVRLVFPDA